MFGKVGILGMIKKSKSKDSFNKQLKLESLKIGNINVERPLLDIRDVIYNKDQFLELWTGQHFKSETRTGDINFNIGSLYKNFIKRNEEINELKRFNVNEAYDFSFNEKLLMVKFNYIGHFVKGPETDISVKFIKVPVIMKFKTKSEFSFVKSKIEEFGGLKLNKPRFYKV